MRIGLLGLGKHGIRYANHLQKGDIDGATLHSLWRRNQLKGSEQAAQLGATLQPTLGALIEEAACDAIVAAVPVGLHLEIAQRAAAAGKPLLLEKPLARSLNEAEQIIEQMERARAPLMVAQTLRFDPLLLALRGHAATGQLGLLTGFSFTQRLEPRALPWEDEPEASGGGVLRQTAVHAIDALLFTTTPEGSLHPVKAEVVAATSDQIHYHHNEDHAALHLRLSSPLGGDRRLLGQLNVSKIGRAREMRYTLYFEYGALEADFIRRELIATELREQSATAIPDLPTVPATLRAFVDFVEGGAENPIPGEQAARAIALIDQAYALL